MDLGSLPADLWATLSNWITGVSGFLTDWVTSLQASGDDLLSQLSDSIGGFITDNGILAPFGLLLVEEAGVPLPVPGDVSVMYVGHRIATEEIDWWVAWFGLVATVVAGSSVLYWVARWKGEGLIRRVGRFIHVNESSMRRAERWFNRRGVLAVIFGRHIPGLRIPITLAAGTLRFSYPLFAGSVAVSTAVWAGVFLIIGATLGQRAMNAVLHPHAGSHVIVGLGLVGLLLAVIVLRRRARRGATHRERALAGGPA
jgi:membrane protein DedA with SNARE-associated domain